ncbi:hypothetical protein J3Q64DRAFT_1701577 [Phycomyces blakesleeanus]|uniref:dolichol kinase n=1 Tax=Phycomyces blakesleeanus TaxID=4837 RepID=A0ABR3AQE2_PHYBL
MAINPTIPSLPNDEGFASTLEEQQTADIIRRKKAQSLNSLASLTQTINETKSNQKHMALTERLLWLISVFWALWKLQINDATPLDNLTVIGTCHILSHHKPLLFSSSEDQSSSSDDTSDPSISPKINYITRNIRKSEKTSVLSYTKTRIFGTGQSSFRYVVIYFCIPLRPRDLFEDCMSFIVLMHLFIMTSSGADDGLLCGVLLLPMVATAKLVEKLHQKSDSINIDLALVHLELLLLMSFIFLILVSASRFMHPMKRIIRKRGVFLASIFVSGLFTVLATRFTNLMPVLSRVPIVITIITVTTFQWALYVCVVGLKKSFTLGEMCILAEAVAILVHGSLDMIWATYLTERSPYYLAGMPISQITVLIHALILGILLIGMALFPLLRRSRWIARQPYWRSPITEDLNEIYQKRVKVSIAFYTLSISIILFGIAPVCYNITGNNPIVWTLEFVLMSPSRLFLSLYWAFSVAATVVVWVLVLDFTPEPSQKSFFKSVGEERILTSTLNKKRKLFHALAVVMFIPGVLFEPLFLKLAFAVALALFIYLEYLRYFAVWPYGKSLHMFLTEFIDNRDLGPVILSHIYLLIGCASTVWLESSHILASVSGILSLGVGDAANFQASLVGKSLGRLHWAGTKKTVEGTIAYITAVLISSYVVIQTAKILGVEGASQLIWGKKEWVSYTIMVTMTGLLEAFSTQNDNIIIPLYMFALVLLGLPL